MVYEKDQQEIALPGAFLELEVALKLDPQLPDKYSIQQVLDISHAKDAKEEMLIIWGRNSGGGGKGRPDVQFSTSMLVKPRIYC